MKLFTLTGVACIVGVALVGCAQVQSASSDPTHPQTPEPTGIEAGEGAKDEPDPVNADSESCLYGDWVADNSFFLASIREFGDEVQSVSGQVQLRFEVDGTLTTTYDDWIISAVTDGMDVQVERIGTDIGTFSATSDTVSIADTDIGSTISMRTAGMNMAIDPHPANYNAVPYSCDGESATIETDDGVLQLSRE